MILGFLTTAMGFGMLAASDMTGGTKLPFGKRDAEAPGPAGMPLDATPQDAPVASASEADPMLERVMAVSAPDTSLAALSPAMATPVPVDPLAGARWVGGAFEIPVITDYEAGEDQLVVAFDPDGSALPRIGLVPVPGSDDVHVTLNGQAVMRVEGAAGQLTAKDIHLVRSHAERAPMAVLPDPDCDQFLWLSA